MLQNLVGNYRFIIKEIRGQTLADIPTYTRMKQLKMPFNCRKIKIKHCIVIIILNGLYASESMVK